mgnify:CR=1 FL=1
MIFSEALCDVKLGQSGNQEANCFGVLVSDVDLYAKFVDNLINFVLIWHIWTVFTHDPSDDLH